MTAVVQAAAPGSAIAARDGPAPARSQLHALTGLRFVAAFHVLLFHTTPWDRWALPAPLRNVVGSGYVAVSLFFILSGFILTYAHLGDDKRPVDRNSFWVSRFARIYPAYAFALVLGAPFFVGHTVRTEGLSPTLVKAVAVSTLTQAYFPPLAMAWNPPAWSLSAEAFFYALFPWVAPRLMRCRPAIAATAAVGCYAVCLVVPMAYMVISPDGPASPTHGSLAFWLSFVRYHPLVRLPEFVIGIILGRWYLKATASGRPVPGALASLAAVGAITAALASPLRAPYPVLHNGLLAPLFALLIISLTSSRGPIAYVLSTPSLVALGEASYSLYVLHVPLLVLWSKTAGILRLEILRQTSGGSVLFLMFAVAASLMCYRYVELPFRQRIIGAFRARGARSPTR